MLLRCTTLLILVDTIVIVTSTRTALSWSFLVITMYIIRRCLLRVDLEFFCSTADHSMKVLKRSGKTTPQVQQEIQKVE